MAKLVALIISSDSETKFFKDVLEMRGFRVSTHSDIESMSDSVGDERPDLIVVDLQRNLDAGLRLPTGNAWQAGLGDVPMLGLVPSPEVLRQALANGYTSCLLMPTVILELWAAFRPFIGNGIVTDTAAVEAAGEDARQDPAERAGSGRADNVKIDDPPLREGARSYEEYLQDKQDSEAGPPAAQPGTPQTPKGK
ncbi:MAG: hypothetical protein O7I42_18580, partial [Alphaproteobacteria bacterium]|nr:hypothetical protein [Alphaproteobacteria bacterium]